MDAAPQHQIRIEAEKPRAALGDSISLRVVFRNVSGEAIELRDPLRGFGVVIAAQRGSAPAEEIRFGKLLTVQMGRGTALVPEPAETFELKPGEERAFQVEAGRRFPQLFAPGTVAVRIVDRSERTPVSSNAVRLHIELTAKSVDFLIGLLADPEAPGRDFALEWLRRLQPSFRFTVELPTEAQRAENEVALEGLRKWWTEARGKPDATRRLAELNEAPSR